MTMWSVIVNLRFLLTMKLLLQVTQQDVKRILCNSNLELNSFLKMFLEELIQEITRDFSSCKLRNIPVIEIYCHRNCSSFGYLCCQAKYGDYNKEIHKPGYLANDGAPPAVSEACFTLYSVYLRCIMVVFGFVLFCFF